MLRMPQRSAGYSIALLPLATVLLCAFSCCAETRAPKQCVAHWTDTPPVIDGRLDDAAWHQAPETGDFILVSTKNKRPQAPTFVRVLTDGKAIYLGLRCVEPNMDKVRVTQTNRDGSVWTDDSLEVVLDPNNGRTKLYHLIINSAGVQYDAEGTIKPPETSNDEPKWDGQWQSVCSRGAGEWYAEYRLPFEVFGISRTNGDCVGLNLGRGRVGAHREESSWSPTQTEYVNPAFLGELYLPEARGGVLRVDLPKALDRVRGDSQVDLNLAYTGGGIRQVRWSVSLDEAGNGVTQTGTLAVASGRSAKASIPLSLERPGESNLRLTVQDADSGRTLYRGFRSFKILPEIEIAEALYALSYQRAEARITVNLPPNAIKGARLRTSLLRQGDAVPLAAETVRVRSGQSNEFCFNLRGKEAGNYLLRVELLRGGRPISSADSRILPFAPNPAVGFDGNGFLTVAGKPWFPVGLYTVQAREGSHDAIMEEARQAGFNTTVFYAYTVETITPLLDAAQRHDLRAFVYPANPYRVRELKATREELVGEIQARMRHPALLGWSLVDEPEGIGVSSVETVRNYYQLVKETDPSHPCSLVIMSPGAAARYGNSADIVWIDPYPIPHSPVTYVSECMDGAHASVEKDKPVWTIPQAFDWSVWKTGKIDETHRPTPAEERCMTYLALVHGAKGIIYWAHTASKYYIRDYPEHWTALKSLAGELRDLSPVLLAPASRIKATPSPKSATLDLMVKELDGYAYIFAVNREPKSCLAQLSLDGAPTVSDIEVLFENRTLPRGRRGWADEFKPLEVHVYRVKTR